MLLIAGISLAVVSSAVLLVGGWGNTQPPSAAAYRGGPAEIATAAIGPAAADVVVPGDGATATARPTLRSAPTPKSAPMATAEPASRSAGGAPAAATAVRLRAATNTPTPYIAPAAPPAAPTVRRLATAAPRVATATAVSPPPPRPTSTPVPPPASCPNAGLSTYAAFMHDALNAERAAFGLGPLGNAGCVNYVAQLRVDDMAALNYFSHTSPSGATAFSLLDAYRIPHGWAGENLARNNYPVDEAVGVAARDLMASEGHRANILNTNFTHIGVAAAFDGTGMIYFAMVYIGVP